MSTQTKKKTPTPEQVLAGLQAARQHIADKWVRGSWFNYTMEDGSKSGDAIVPEGAVVTGVCAAGSILYALDYTDEQWTSKDDVRPVMEALFEALPKNSKALRQYKELTDTSYWADLAPEKVYEEKVSAIVSWNDTTGRTKTEVLAAFDRAIANMTAAQSLTIQELP